MSINILMAVVGIRGGDAETDSGRKMILTFIESGKLIIVYPFLF